MSPLEAAWQARRQVLISRINSTKTESTGPESEFALQIYFFEELTGISSDTAGLLGVSPTARLEKETIPAWDAWFEENKDKLEVDLSQCPISLRPVDRSSAPRVEDRNTALD
jgi:hypothetical protein